MSAGAAPLLTMGVASMPEHTIDGHELEQLASGTLYWSKLNGKATVTLYDPRVVRVLNVEDRVQVLEQNARLRAVLALARALDARDAYTARHSQNVAKYAVAIAQQLGWTARAAGAAAHRGPAARRGQDRRARLGAAQAREAHRRRVAGDVSAPRAAAARVITGIAPDEIIPWVLSHHERVDGRGYPNALRGEQIPLAARILAVADTFDAMTSSRAYRPALPVLWAVNELVASVGKQFDPNVVRAFMLADPVRRIRLRDGCRGPAAGAPARGATAVTSDPEFAPTDVMEQDAQRASQEAAAAAAASAAAAPQTPSPAPEAAPVPAPVPVPVPVPDGAAAAGATPVPVPTAVPVPVPTQGPVPVPVPVPVAGAQHLVPVPPPAPGHAAGAPAPAPTLPHQGQDGAAGAMAA